MTTTRHPSLSRRSLLRGAAGLVGAMALGLPPRTAMATTTLEIRPRAAWADRPPTGPLSVEADGDVRFLLVHHTASSNAYAEADVPGLLRSFARYHTGAEKGWPDIAYNFLIDRFGGVWEGREGSLVRPVIGSATGGNQGFSQLACFIGDHSSEPPTEAAQAAMIALLALLADRYAVDTTPGAQTAFVSRGSNRHAEGTEVVTATITGHREMSQTACPGDAAMRFVTYVLPAEVTRRRGLAAAAPPPPQPASQPRATEAVSQPTPAAHAEQMAGTNRPSAPAVPTATPRPTARPTPTLSAAEVTDGLAQVASAPTPTPTPQVAVRGPLPVLGKAAPPGPTMPHPAVPLIGLGLTGLVASAVGPRLRSASRARRRPGRHEAGAAARPRSEPPRWRGAQGLEAPPVTFVAMPTDVRATPAPPPSTPQPAGWGSPDPSTAAGPPSAAEAATSPRGSR